MSSLLPDINLVRLFVTQSSAAGYWPVSTPSIPAQLQTSPVILQIKTQYVIIIAINTFYGSLPALLAMQLQSSVSYAFVKCLGHMSV